MKRRGDTWVGQLPTFLVVLATVFGAFVAEPATSVADVYDTAVST